MKHQASETFATVTRAYRRLDREWWHRCRRACRACAGITLLAFFLASPVRAQETNALTTNGSVTIATGNTFQQVLAVLGSPPASRRSVTIQNNNTNGDNCWLFIGGGAATKAISILLGQGGSYQRYFPYVPADAVQATCTTTAMWIRSDD